MRAIAGIIFGLVVGLFTTILIGIIGVGMTFSVPAGVDVSNAREVIELFASMPAGPKIALMVAWFASGFAGALVAKLVARKGWVAWTVTGLLAAYVLLNTVVLPLPGWMQALSIAAPLVGGLIANHLVKGASAVEEDSAAAPEGQG